MKMVDARKNHMETLFVTGYWRLPNYRKRSLEYYAKQLPLTLDMLAGGSLLFFFEDDDLLKTVQIMAQERKINLIEHYLPFNELPGHKAASGFLRSCEAMALTERPNVPIKDVPERGVALYWRDYRDAGSDVYESLIAIWLSRVPLMGEVVQKKEFEKFQRFTWTDVSLSRFYGRPKWDFRMQKQPLNKISHYGNRGEKHGKPLPMNAAYLSGGRAVWQMLDVEFETSVKKLQLENYANDDETVLADVETRVPSLFYQIARPSSRTSMKLKNYFRRLTRDRFRKVRQL